MKDLKFDVNKSLEELENEIWERPDFESSLINNVLNIRKKPIKNLTTEDLRLLIGQQFSLDYVIPMAFQILDKNPFAEGDYYSGDLLHNVLSVKKEFWETRPELHQQLKQILQKAKDHLIEIDDKKIEKLVIDALKDFDMGA